MKLEPFKITYKGRYYTSGVIPPRCRKPRTVDYDFECEIRIPRIKSEDAPVALRASSPLKALRTSSEENSDEYRLFRNKLYLPYLPHSRQTEMTEAGSEKFSNVQQDETRTLGDLPNDKEAVKAIRKQYRRFLIIDDEVWTIADEPIYTVKTFGMGANHGGTSIVTERASWSKYNKQARGITFRVDEFELAKQAATKIAINRGDTESLKNFERYPVEILIPEAVKFKSKTWLAAQREAKRQQKKADEVKAINAAYLNSEKSIIDSILDDS